MSNSDLAFKIKTILSPINIDLETKLNIHELLSEMCKETVSSPVRVTLLEKMARDATEDAFEGSAYGESFDERCAYTSGFKQGFWEAKFLAENLIKKIGQNEVDDAT